MVGGWVDGRAGGRVGGCGKLGGKSYTLGFNPMWRKQVLLQIIVVDLYPLFEWRFELYVSTCTGRKT